MNPPVPKAAARPTAPNAVAAGAQRKNQDKLRGLINSILSSDSITRTLFELIGEFKQLFNADKITIYAIDRPKRQLFSRNFKNNKVEEIRVEITPKSLAGFVAASGRTLNVLNAYDKTELTKIHPELSLDKSFDETLGYKTKSVLVVALPHNRKIMGMLQIINKQDKPNFTDQDVRRAKELASTLGHAIVKMQTEIIDEKIQATSHAIHSAGSLDEILIELRVPILQLFDCKMVIIYVVDAAKKELYSKLKPGSTAEQLRFPINASNIPGCVCMEKRVLNVKNVNDQVELVEYHPDLMHDKTLESQLGTRTKSMLVAPLILEGKHIGVLQLANKQNEIAFTPQG